MLERYRQFEGADQMALFGSPKPTLVARLLSVIRRYLG